MVDEDWRFRLSFVIAVLVMASVATPALAYLDGYETRTVVSANQQYVLVLLTPHAERADRRLYDPEQDGPLDEEGIQRWNESVVRQQQLEAIYPQSGVYRNDGSIALLWPMPYLSVCKDVWLSNDGEHVVVAFLGWNLTNISSRGDALEFFSRGQSLATYHEEALISGVLFKTLVAHCLGYEAPHAREANLLDATGKFELVTNSGERLQFNVATGGLASHWSPWPTYFVATLVVTSLLIWRVLHWARRKARQRRAGIPA